MTVSSTTTRNSYSGDGSTTVFAYGFKIFDDDDITVIVRTNATGAESVQTKTTDYTVSGVGGASARLLRPSLQTTLQTTHSQRQAMKMRWTS